MIERIVELFYFIFFRLNEGFASWMENIGSNYTHPERKDVIINQK